VYKSTIRKILILFIIYSIVGWLYEFTLWSFELHQLMNRGFLFGPWLPIYGFGGLIIYRFCYKYATKPVEIGNTNVKPLMVGIIISIAAALIELVSTLILDKVGIDWTSLWKYDDYSINFQERVALLPSIKFGILGCIIIYGVQAKIENFVNNPSKRQEYVQYIIFAIFIIDLIYHLINGSHYTDIPFLLL